MKKLIKRILSREKIEFLYEETLRLNEKLIYSENCHQKLIEDYKTKLELLSVENHQLKDQLTTTQFSTTNLVVTLNALVDFIRNSFLVDLQTIFKNSHSSILDLKGMWKEYCCSNHLDIKPKDSFLDLFFVGRILVISFRALNELPLPAPLERCEIPEDVHSLYEFINEIHSNDAALALHASLSDFILQYVSFDPNITYAQNSQRNCSLIQ
jgi:hypothetical protein